MEFKILNKDEITEENREKFLKFIEETLQDYHKQAFTFLDNLYSFKNVFIYNIEKPITKICSFIITFGIIFNTAIVMNNYINYMLYDIKSLENSIMNIILIFIQMCCLALITYNDMMISENYKEQCRQKLIKSEFNQKFIKDLLKKAEELNIKIEIINE